jgi:hypothetical protein
LRFSQRDTVLNQKGHKENGLGVFLCMYALPYKAVTLLNYLLDLEALGIRKSEQGIFQESNSKLGDLLGFGGHCGSQGMDYPCLTLSPLPSYSGPHLDVAFAECL